jgi:hypothetical protein
MMTLDVSEFIRCFLNAAPRAFVSTPRRLGRLGSTNLLLAYSNEPMGERALAAAGRNVAPKSLLNRIDRPDS